MGLLGGEVELEKHTNPPKKILSNILPHSNLPYLTANLIAQGAKLLLRISTNERMRNRMVRNVKKMLENHKKYFFHHAYEAHVMLILILRKMKFVHISIRALHDENRLL